MKVLNSLFVICVLMLLSSCNSKEEHNKETEIRERYFRLENIGWKSKSYTQKADDIFFTATEVPIQYYFLKDKGNQDLQVIDSLYNQNNRERVIEFMFQQDEEKDLLGKEFTGMDFTSAVKYMSFGLEKDFYVVTSKNDTIACDGVTFERNYKVAPYQKVLVFFSGISPEEEIQLVYKDYIFRKGVLKFRFKNNYTEIAL